MGGRHHFACFVSSCPVPIRLKTRGMQSKVWEEPLPRKGQPIVGSSRTGRNKSQQQETGHFQVVQDLGELPGPANVESKKVLQTTTKVFSLFLVNATLVLY